MIPQTYSDIVTPELLTGAIENNEFTGFREDYHVLHCLIRKYMPTTFFEIGTNMGTGTNIICNAGKNWMMKVYSLDLPTELAHISLQHPISEGKGDKVGSRCTFGYTQLRGDSLNFDYSKYPCDGYWVDAEHTYRNVNHETKEVLKQNPKLIAFHDTDIVEVMQGITDAYKSGFAQREYNLYRVSDTRISYLLRK